MWRSPLQRQGGMNVQVSVCSCQQGTRQQKPETTGVAVEELPELVSLPVHPGDFIFECILPSRRKNQKEYFGQEGEEHSLPSVDKGDGWQFTPWQHSNLGTVFLPTPEMFEGKSWEDVGSPGNKQPKRLVAKCLTSRRSLFCLVLRALWGKGGDGCEEWRGGWKCPRLAIKKEPN